MDSIQDRIAWNSALNNAVNLVGAMVGIEPNLASNAAAMKKCIETWQSWFYKNLTQRPEPNRAVASEKGRSDAEHDAGLADTIN